MVTLTGTGGCGKTRLAVAVADSVAARFDDGIAWVELTGVGDPDTVATAVAGALGVSAPPSQDVMEALAQRIGDECLLLTIDNCEHLLPACAALVTEMLRACQHLRVLATSREPLMIEGESVFEVPPLAVPDPTWLDARRVREASAARLFELRAQRVRPDFLLDEENAPAVGAICRRLDGIPLAVELAAARVRVLSPAQIAAGLSDRFRLLTDGYRTAPRRQQTLEASVAWSYGLLADRERSALARLSVFAGTFDLEAAEAVTTGPDGEASDVLELVSRLVDRSLLQVAERRGRARYRLLETIRFFARERLDELDETSRVRDLHLDHFVDLAARAGRGLSGPDAPAWTDRLTADLDDLRAAMAWATDSGRASAVLTITEPTQRFWLDHGRYPELEHWLRVATEAPNAPDEDRARGLATATVVMVGAGRYRSAHAFAERSVSVARRIDAQETLALSAALRSFTGVQSGLGSNVTIAPDVEEAVALAACLEDAPTRALVLIFAGLTECYGGEIDVAHDLFARAVETCGDAGVSFHRPAAHALLGVPCMLSGDVDGARAQALAALEWSRHVDRPGWESAALVVLATTDALVGAPDDARARRADAAAVLDARNLCPSTFELFVGRWAALAACHSGETVEARDAGVALRQRARELGAPHYEASAELVLGLLARAEERAHQAREHLERSRRLSDEPRSPLTYGRALIELADLDGESDGALELAHEGLEVLAESGHRLGVAEALEVIAGGAATFGRPDQALRLLAATERFRADAGIVPSSLQSERARAATAAAEDQLDTDEVAARRREGARLTLDESVGYARRGRGARDRPQVGWAALTPTEQEVARLVGDGCTNGEIGERLFVSVHTVKKHLSQVYAKVGLTGRAELVAEVARREG